MLNLASSSSNQSREVKAKQGLHVPLNGHSQKSSTWQMLATLQPRAGHCKPWLEDLHSISDNVRFTAKNQMIQMRFGLRSPLFLCLLWSYSS